MLKVLDGFSGHSSSSHPSQANHNVLVRTPHLFHFDQDRNTQILEDLPDALDLKRTLLLLPPSSQQRQYASPGSSIPGISSFPAMSIGHALGTWLASFHAWTSLPAQSNLRTEIRKNEDMKTLKHRINYVDLLRMVEKFPEILEGSRSILESVSDMAAKELAERDDGEGEEFGIIHGDFWTGKYVFLLFCFLLYCCSRDRVFSLTGLPTSVLISQSDAASKKNPSSSTETTTLFVIDWELCQMGPRALDLGQMIAELYEVKHFKDIDAGTLVLQGFVEGYRTHHPFSEEMAFRTAIHVGAHLICFGSTVRGWGAPKQVEELVRVGRDFIVKAWKRDRKWFEQDGTLGCLFEGRESITG
jgi:thiamine kinase-like enzyme